MKKIVFENVRCKRSMKQVFKCVETGGFEIKEDIGRVAKVRFKPLKVVETGVKSRLNRIV